MTKFKVGDTVLISKPKVTNTLGICWWVGDMDQYDNTYSIVKSVDENGDYRLSEGYFYREVWLSPVGDNIIER